MEKFAVIGLGRFGDRLARLLAEAGADVIAIDRERAAIDAIRDEVSLAVCMDATKEDALRAQGVDKVDAAIVGLGTNFEDSVLTTVLLKQIGVKRVVARASSEVRAKVLLSVGADEVANPERESADRWQSRLLAPAVMERIELAEGYSLTQIEAPRAFHSKTLEQLQIRKKHKVNVVAIRRTVDEAKADGKEKSRQFVISVPMADTTILPGDILLLIGSDDDIAALPD